MPTVAIDEAHQTALAIAVFHEHPEPTAAGPAPIRLSVLRGFELRAWGRSVAVPPNVERMMAYLAVRERPQLRTKVAATLWMDTPEQRAAGNLRTCLWKSRHALGDVVRVTGSYLSLATAVRVDLSDVVAQARRLIGSGDELLESDTNAEALIGDLLPEWDEDWILFERERLRQLRVHALEALCRRLSSAGRHAEAVDAGQAAVAAEPLRESAQRALVTAHLAEGNRSEASRQYELYRVLLLDALAIEPSDTLRAMVRAGRE